MVEKKRWEKINIRQFIRLFLPLAAMGMAFVLHMELPTVYPDGYEAAVYPAFLKICIGAYSLFALAACISTPIREKMLHLSWLIAALFLLVELLDIATLKTGNLRLPYVPSPDKILDTAVSQYDQLLINIAASLKLLFTGLLAGVVTGLISGLLMGWSKICNYWFTPILKIIGPVPAAAWLPIVMVLFPTGHVAGIFLIALSVWFPLTLNFSSAIRNTDKKLIETARVLGASDVHIMFHVAIPAAVPSIFTGLFMGFSASFGALVVAEMLGVKAGLGWYIEWARAWAEYGRLYFSVLLFIILFFALMSLLFRIRDKLLKWQKGSVRW